MKLFSMLSIIIILFQICRNARGQIEGCMTLMQIIAATNELCTKQRNNKVLWQQVIDCHKPISEEFMRKSGEAQCPIPKQVEDPTDTNYSIQDVFFNLCGLVDGGFINQFRGAVCIAFGKSNPYVMSHSSEVAAIKTLWGNDVPCNIGKCVLGLNIT